MGENTKKIVLVGAGAVGMSFLYSAMNRGVANQYEIIDAFPNSAEGNVLDTEDVIATANNSFSVKVGNYKSCKNADLIVITAGRPQKDGETRLDLMIDNAKIIKSIAMEIKKSGFKGVTLIASNPVDIMTTVYLKTTGFNKNLVISSGTSLDSARLRFEIAKRINISPRSIEAYVMGEHGDSSVSVFSAVTVRGVPLSKFEKSGLIKKSEFSQIHKTVYMKAYEIINKKRVTCYGIGSALADISEAIINDYNEVKAVGAYLDGEYGQTGSYVGVPAVVGKTGIKKILEIDLSKEEKAQFVKSFNLLKNNTKEVLTKIK